MLIFFGLLLMSKIANLAIAPTPQPPLSMSPQIPIPYSWSGDTACCFADRGKMHQELLILPEATFTNCCYCCRCWCCWLLWLEASISLIWIFSDIWSFVHQTQGRVTVPNQKNFRENSKRPSTTPSFSENCIANLYNGYKVFKNWRHHIWLHICK